MIDQLIDAAKTFFMVAGIFNTACMFAFVGLIWCSNRGQAR